MVAEGAVQSQCRHAAIEIGVLSAPSRPLRDVRAKFARKSTRGHSSRTIVQTVQRRPKLAVGKLLGVFSEQLVLRTAVVDDHSARVLDTLSNLDRVCHSTFAYSHVHRQ